MYKFLPDDVDNPRKDVRMVDANDGGPVGRIVEHGPNEYVGHFDSIKMWWPVKEKTLDFAKLAMIIWAAHPKVLAKIS